MKQLLLVGIFGAFGAVSRFALSSFLLRAWGDSFPWGTFLVNVTGCGLIGALFQLERTTHWLPAEWRIAFVAGFLGALTTFSTFGLETVRLVELGRYPSAITNVLANVIVGLGAVIGGMAVVRWSNG